MNQRFCQEKKQKQTFRIVSRLGSGSYGIVYLAIDVNTKKYVALKKIDLSDDDSEELKFIENELSIWKILSDKCSTFVPRLYDWFCRGETLTIIMEYIEGKSIVEYRKKGGANEFHKIIMSMALGIQCLHKNNIIHMDLHPGNILITYDGEAKIIDFGLSCFDISSCSMTNEFLADARESDSEGESFEGNYPPDFTKKKQDMEDYKKMDIWMLGQDIIILNMRFLSVHTYDDLVKKMMSKNPDKRPTINEVIEELKKLGT